MVTADVKGIHNVVSIDGTTMAKTAENATQAAEEESQEGV